MSAFTEYWNLKSKIEAQIIELERQYGAEAIALQGELYKHLEKNLFAKIEYDKDGQMRDNAHNWTLVRNTEQAWNTYSAKYLNPTFMQYGDDLLGITLMSSNAFKAILPDTQATIKYMTQARELVLQQMGVQVGPGNKLIVKPGGYLDKLTRGSQVQEEITDLLRRNMTVSSSFKDFQADARNIILGSDQVNGAMQRYFRTYVYDTFSGVHASYDNYVAKEAGLNSFIYAGTIIADSRPFCVQHCNKVYSRRIIRRWEKQTWKGKNKEVPFVISRGGYNCRHQLNWITDEMAASLKDGKVGTPPKEKKAAPVKANFIPPPARGGTGAELWASLKEGPLSDFGFIPLLSTKNTADIVKEFLSRMETLGLDVDSTNLLDNLAYLTPEKVNAVLNSVLEGFNRLSRFNPQIKKVSFLGDKSDASGYYSTYEKRIDINLNDMRWHKYKGNKGSTSKNSGRHFLTGSLVEDNLMNTVIHEGGHAVSLYDHITARKGAYQKFCEIVAEKFIPKSVIDDWKKGYGDKWALYENVQNHILREVAQDGIEHGLYISDYGTTNMKELFAECFSGIDAGIDYSPKLMEALEEWFLLL